MTGKKKLILYPSKKMDSNKKSNRNENRLVRMSAKARKFLGFTGDQVEVWTAGNNATDRAAGAVLLDIFQAFKDDIDEVKKRVNKGELKPGDLNRIGFVTSKMYARITGGDSDKNIWISSGVHDTVIGADPEFLLFANGEVINAAGVPGMNKTNIIGCDGAMAEVRPGPATTPNGLVDNIMKAFKDGGLTDPIKNYDWIATCYHKNSSRDFPVAGHIHVGNPAKIANMPMSKREIFFRVLNKIMDELIAIPCIRLDGDLGCSRRAHCQMGLGKPGWGYFGELRTDRGRLEHRTLSGMWLTHPSLAKAVIGVAKAVTDEVFKRWSDRGFNMDYVMPTEHASKNNKMFNRGFEGWKDSKLCQDMHALKSSTEMRQVLDDSKAGDVTKAFLKSWHDNMRRLSTYNKYSTYIDALQDILSRPITEIKNWDRRIQNTWLRNKKFVVNI